MWIDEPVTGAALVGSAGCSRTQGSRCPQGLDRLRRCTWTPRLGHPLTPLTGSAARGFSFRGEEAALLRMTGRLRRPDQPVLHPADREEPGCGRAGHQPLVGVAHREQIWTAFELLPAREVDRARERIEPPGVRELAAIFFV